MARAEKKPGGYGYCECGMTNLDCQCHAQVHYVGDRPSKLICSDCAQGKHKKYT